MTISRDVLARHSEPNVILAEGYEFLCDVIQNFLDSDLPEQETFLLARLDDGRWLVQSFAEINRRLSRMGPDELSRILYRALEDLTLLHPAEQVVEMTGSMTDAQVAAWKRPHREGKALVVMDGDEFAGLVFEPVTWRSSLDRSLRDLFPYGAGSKRREEAIGLPDDQSFAPSKGLTDPPPPVAFQDRELHDAPPAFPAERFSFMDEAASSEAAEETMEAPVEEAAEEAIERAAPIEPAIQRPFHTDIRFAHWLKPGETRPLTVQLTLEAAEKSMSKSTVTVGFVEEFTPETIQVHVDAPGFSVRNNVWQESIDVYSFQDSDKATFILTAGQEEGERQISIDFRHRERLIGNTRFVMHVSATEPAAAGPAAADALTFRQPPPDIAIPPSPPPPPDVELRIRADGNRLTFELHSTHQAVDASHAPMGGVELSADPQKYMEERYNELNEWARQRPVDADVVAEVSNQLTAVGNSLFLHLFPDKLKRQYWKLVKLRKQGTIKSLHIISDEPWIPWEMVKPVDLDEDVADDYLAQGWQVSRWLAGPGQADRLRISEARLVAPNTDLEFVQREVQFFAGLSGRSVAVDEPVRQLAQVRAIAKQGVELLHFSTHGRVNSQNIDSSSILLEDNAELRPIDLLGEAVLGLRRRRPLVFMNTCHGARMGFSLAGLGGWATQMINQVKAGVFIGALWEVNDVLAADFALAFYSELQEGKTLGDAFHTARMSIREKAPANSTWLAYTLYGDPNMRIDWGASDQ